MSLWTFSLCIYAQNIVVTGTVRDSAGEPLVGVTVQIQGTSHGTVTDYDGGFRIANVFSDAVLEFRYVGMQEQAVPVNGRTTINVVFMRMRDT